MKLYFRDFTRTYSNECACLTLEITTSRIELPIATFKCNCTNEENLIPSIECFATIIGMNMFNDFCRVYKTYQCGKPNHYTVICSLKEVK